MCHTFYLKKRENMPFFLEFLFTFFPNINKQQTIYHQVHVIHFYFVLIFFVCNITNLYILNNRIKKSKC